jgi:SnoaL-like domain
MRSHLGGRGFALRARQSRHDLGGGRPVREERVIKTRQRAFGRLALDHTESFTGSDRVAANWTAIFARFPDFQARVLRRAADGDGLWSEWEMTGSDPAGNPALQCGPVIMTTRNGQIAWTRFYLSPVAAPTDSPFTPAL